MIIDLEMIRKYDRPGPRYTSYPTAPHFHEGFTSAEYQKEIEDTNRGDGPFPDISLYYHLPFCDTLCYFCGCNMIITRNRSRIAEYLKYLKKEITLLRGKLHADRVVSQLHWGGGTPTHLNPEEIADLTRLIYSEFSMSPDAENGCEIDPRGLSYEHLEALRKGGFNRISMGVQDFYEPVQKAVNRIQPEEMTRQVIDWVRQLGFSSINLDLMYGLPHQTLDSFAKTVDTTIQLSPDRIAVFNYAHLPWLKKHMGLIREEDLPKPEEKLEILKMTIEKLTDANYVFIGMDHFAKPEDELSIALREKKLYRNFQGYSTHAGTDIYALGITSISQLTNVYAQNEKREKDYFAALDAGKFPVTKGVRLSEDDQLRRWVITRLMCDFELQIPMVEERFGIDFRNYFKHAYTLLPEFAEDDLVQISDHKIEVTERGRMLIRNLAMCFDGYLERKEDKGRYSRTV